MRSLFDPPPVEPVVTRFDLRPYQVETVDAVYESWEQSDAVLVVQATGLGKTVAIAEIINRWPDNGGRIVVMAHREELIRQAVEKIQFHTSTRPEIEMAERVAGRHGFLSESNVIVTSVQTMSKKRRMERFDPTEIGLLIIDEAHHATADTYRRVIDYFAQGGLKIAGATATPNRKDKSALGAVFDMVAHEMTIQDGIECGWLVDIEQKYITVDGLDFSWIKTTAGDLNERQLAQAMGGAPVADEMDEDQIEALKRQEMMIHSVVAPTVEEADGRPTLVFGVTKEHARRLTEVFNRYGARARCVLGETPKDERRDVVRQFQTGEVQVLVGVGVFTEGFDAPAASVIAIARPTKSSLLYTQMIGRGTRPLSGLVDGLDSSQERIEAIAGSEKPVVTVLDFVGNSGRHKLISAADILGGDYELQDVEAAAEAMKQGGDSANVRDALEEAKELREQRLREAEEEELRARARRAELRAQAQYQTRDVNPFGNDSVPDRPMSTFRGGASDKQVDFMMKLGISEEAAVTYTRSQASAVISELVSREGGSWIMRFGKFSGVALANVPAPYLRWAEKNIRNPELQQNLRMMREGM